jgi:leucyl aminopeptidase
LAQAKEEALSMDKPSRLLTVATLTGHAIRAMGVGYSICLDNGPARNSGMSKRLFEAGHLIGEPFEISTLRREDFRFIQPCSITEDVVQANSEPSTMTSRGHQYPAAFLSVASGLSAHGLDSKNPICYTHVDIAGSAEEGGGGLSLPSVTGAPVAAFSLAFCSINE